MNTPNALQQKLDDLEFYYRKKSVQHLPGGALVWEADGFDVGGDWRELMALRHELNAAALVLNLPIGRLALNITEVKEVSSDEAQAILNAAKQMDAQAWLRARPAQCIDESITVQEFLQSLSLDEAVKVEHLPDDAELEFFQVMLGVNNAGEITGTRLLLLPDVAQTDVHAVLPWGPFNDFPAQHEHVAVLRYLKKKYDVEVVGVTGEIVELCHPWPLAPEVAAALAFDLFCYCPDVLLQSSGGFPALSLRLQSFPTIPLWWD